MSEETKQKINERYKHELNRGERFWPDSIFKDLIVSLGIFVLIVLLATFIGVSPEAKADPSDTSYLPRPEWYFLFLFKFLAIYGQIPLLGKIEWIATVIIPAFAVLLLTVIPFLERNPDRYYGKRILPIAIMALVVVGMLILTLMSDIPTVTPEGSTLPGLLQAVAGLVIPGIAVILLFLISFVFRKASTTIMIWITSVAALLMLAVTGVVLALAPKVETTEVEIAESLVDQISAGQDLYAVQCTECHGDDGAVTTIEGVEGLEGKQISAINGHDVLYTLNDAAMAEVIAYGRPDAGMTPFGKAYNPEGLTKSEIDYMVVFMRYMWDDRFEIPAEALKPLFPPLADGEVPSYEVHIQPIVKRYCISCHREGKENNEYWMTSYQEILTTGDNVENNILPGNSGSYFLQVIQETPIMDPENPDEELIGVMPPNKALKPNIIDVFIRWIMNGMPETAEQAAALYVAPTPLEGTPIATSTP